VTTYLCLVGLTPAYPSHAVLLLQEGYKTNAVPELTAGLFAAVSEKSNLRMLRQLIFSDETMREVDARVGFFAYFAKEGNFFERWLAKETDPDRRFTLYNHVLDVKVDDRSGLVMVDTRAHDPAMARRIGDAIVAVAQERVNDLAQRVAADQMEYLEKEAKRLLAEDRRVQAQVADFQRKTGLSAPEIGVAVGGGGPTGGGSVSSPGDILNGWIQRRGDLQVKLKSMKQFLKPDAPDLQAVVAELSAVDEQIAARKDELTSTSGSTIGGARSEFVNLLTEAELSRELYLGALRSIAQARADASRTLKRVDLVQAPTTATVKDRGIQWISLFSAIVISILSWKLMSLARRYVNAHND
jgi:capsular polysaccharide transport system permease protein